jgi:acyl-phosphate glycerol 3-phosphate acyltransferase
MTDFFLISLIAYLVGSFPTAYFFVKKFTGQDIRKIGSGNVGAMNTVRALKEKSKKLAVTGFLVVLIVDIAKGAFSVFLAQFFLPSSPSALIMAGFFVVLGHNYSIFLKFAGGRGAACLIGILLYLDIFSFIIWGLPVVLCTVLFQIILEKTGFETKINWRKISAIISIFGKQMAGRFAGLFFGPVALYFYEPQIFLPIAAGTILLLIKNIPRFKGYFLGDKINGD